MIFFSLEEYPKSEFLLIIYMSLIMRCIFIIEKPYILYYIFGHIYAWKHAQKIFPRQLILRMWRIASSVVEKSYDVFFLCVKNGVSFVGAWIFIRLMSAKSFYQIFLVTEKKITYARYLLINPENKRKKWNDMIYQIIRLLHNETRLAKRTKENLLNMLYHAAWMNHKCVDVKEDHECVM